MPYFILLLLIVVCPLALGTVDPWAVALMEVGCWLGVLCHLGAAPKPLRCYRVPGLWPLALFLLFLLVQILPLPAALVAAISPATLRVHQFAQEALPAPAWLPLSVAPEATLGELLRFAGYAAFYILAVQLFSSRVLLRRTVLVVVVLGGLVALEALVQKFLGNGRIYWLVEVPEKVRAVGPYVYKNHFAGYVEMVLPLALVLFLHYRPGWGFGKTLRQKAANVLDHPDFNRFLLAGLGVFALVLAMVASLSRGGIISLVLSTLVFVVVLALGGRRAGSVGHGGVFLACLLLAGGLVGWEILDQRFGRMFTPGGELSDGRLDVWRDSLAIIRDYPLFGTGMGTFASIFQSYRTFAGNFFYYNAHNDYIELLTDTGLIGFSLVVWFLLTVIGQAYRAGRQRRDSYARHLTLASLTGVLALLFHSVTDFNFQSGANALYFFLLLALAVSAAHTRSHGQEGSRLGEVALAGGRAPAAILASLLLLLTLAVQAGQWRAGRVLALVEKTALNPETPKEQVRQFADDLARGLTLAPWNAQLSFRLAQASDLLGDVDAARTLFQRAIRLYPAQPTYHLFYAYFLTRQEDMARADSFMRAMVRSAPYDNDLRRTYATWLLRHGDRGKGLDLFTELFTLEPGAAKADIKVLLDFGVTEEDIRAALPERVLPHVAYAAHLAEQGKDDLASAAYLTGLSFVAKEDSPQANFFLPAVSFYQKRHRLHEALSILRQGIDLLPRDVDLLCRAGDLYRQMKLPDLARERYQQALLLAPARQDIRKRLKELEPR